MTPVAARFLDQALFDGLAAGAAASPLLRQHHNLHAMEEPCHRLAVGLQPGTYIAPWAPREGEPGVADYLAWMRAQFP